MMCAMAMAAIAVGLPATATAEPVGVDDFNVLAQAPVAPADVPASVPAAPTDEIRRADLAGGPVYVVSSGLWICVVTPDADGGSGSTCTSLAKARRGRLVGASCTTASCTVTQLVPDGVRFARIGRHRVRVVDNVARATVPRDTAFAYMQSVGKARGLAAYGLR